MVSGDLTRAARGGDSAAMGRTRPIDVRLILVVGTLYAIFAALVSYAFTVRTGRSLWTLQPDESANWWYVLLMNLVYWDSWAVLTPSILWLAQRFRFGSTSWRRPLLVHLAGGVIFSLVHVVVVASGRFGLQALAGMPVSWWPGVQDAFFRTLDWEVTFYWAVVGLSHALDFYTEAQERAVGAAQLKTRLAQAQLEALQRQLHPHFLFNTLDAILALVRKDPDAAELMIERLSDLLRLTLEHTGVQEVPLEQELQYLEKYLEIEKVHLGDRLTWHFDISPETLDALVPYLMLQPLAENAVRHGIDPRAVPGRIEIRSRRMDASLELTVLDDGAGWSSARVAKVSHGVGLANTRARLERLYGSRQRLNIVQPPKGGLSVSIAIPYRQMDVAGQSAGSAP